MSSPLLILAGPEAQRRIREHGFSLDLFDTFVGASGGPKWLTLYGIDKALCEAFAARTRPMDLIGSSIGAMRIACHAQIDPVRAFDRFLESYVGITLQNFDRGTLAAFIRNTIEVAVEGSASEEILSNRKLRAHIVTVRAAGPAVPDAIAPLSMLLPAALNALHPKLLAAGGIVRTLFVTDPATPIAQNAEYAGKRIQLTAENLLPALIASGAIPGLLEGVRNIPGAPRGTYWDGGITDYHFNPSWHHNDGLILYPHFAPTLIPGWFDKPFRSRHLDPQTIDRLVVLAPSPEFIAALPHGKIPDRRDVKWLSPKELHLHWTTTARESESLGDALRKMLGSGAHNSI